MVSLSTYQSARMAEGEAGKKYYFILTEIMGKNKFFSDLSVAERVMGKHTWIIYFKNCNKTKKNSDTENPNRNQYLGLRENVYMTRKNFGAKLCFWIVLLFLWMVIEFNLALKSFLASVFSIVTCLNYFTMINRNSNIQGFWGIPISKYLISFSEIPFFYKKTMCHTNFGNAFLYVLVLLL